MNSTIAQDTHPADSHTPAQADFWQVVGDILDNPFIKPCERDGALLERGYKVVSSVITLDYSC